MSHNLDRKYELSLDVSVQKMTPKKHPTYRRNRLCYIFIVLCISVAYLYHIDAIRNETLGDQWYIPVGLFITILLYNPIIGFFVKCPKCKIRLKMQPHIEDKHSKANCIKCETTWDLGVAFKTKDDGQYYDDCD